MTSIVRVGYCYAGLNISMNTYIPISFAYPHCEYKFYPRISETFWKPYPNYGIYTYKL